MKLIFQISILGLAMINAFCAIAQTPGTFVINGKLQTTRPGKVYLSYQLDGKRVSDSAALSNGAFVFKGEIIVPTVANLAYGNTRSYDPNNMASFFLAPGTITVELEDNNFSKAHIIGGSAQKEHQEYEQSIRRIRDQWKVVMDTLSAINKRSNVAFQETKAWVMKPYEAAINDVNAAFIKKYPGSYKTLDLILGWASYNQITVDSAKKLQAAFPVHLKNSAAGKSFSKTLEELAVKSKIGAVGSKALMFAKPDINGNQLKLASYKGKYVLLDFWASWCVPCRKGNPHLISLYSKYKPKGFEIIGVSDDDRNHLAWKKAVDQDKIGVWKHVLRGFDPDKRMTGVKNENDLLESYNVRVLPTKILVDPNGFIIGRYDGSKEGDEAMDKKLAEIFKN